MPAAPAPYQLALPPGPGPSPDTSPDSWLAATRTPSPFSGYRGGKFRLARRLIALFPAHVCYVEPFCGSACLLFAKKPSNIEVLCDAWNELINAWRVIRNAGPDLRWLLQWSVRSRAEFERLRDMDAEELAQLDPTHRAWRLLYLHACAFGGWLNKPAFGTCASHGGANNSRIARLLRNYEAIRARLMNVIIENLPWQETLARYDRATTFFYLDPPYFGHEHDYGKDLFSRGQFAELAQRLTTLKGKFLLSLNDCPQMRALFSKFEIAATSLNYMCNRDRQYPARELIIKNY